MNEWMFKLTILAQDHLRPY